MTTTGYNPVFRGIPTDANTIYTVLKVTEGHMQPLVSTALRHSAKLAIQKLG